MSTNKMAENDMHPGLFAEATRLRELHLEGNTEMRRFDSTELFPGGSKTVTHIDLRRCGMAESTNFDGLTYLKWLDLRESVVLPPRLFSGLCALRRDWLDLEGVKNVSWSNDTFAGTTLCYAITNNNAAKQACWEQADGDSESVCGCRLASSSLCEEDVS